MSKKEQLDKQVLRKAKHVTHLHTAFTLFMSDKNREQATHSTKSSKHFYHNYRKTSFL